MNKHYNKKPGRPSLNKQHQMEEMLLPYFQQQLTAFSVSKMPNMPNIKTISRIFKKFARILDRQLDFDIEKAQREARAQLIFSFDKNLSLEILEYEHRMGSKLGEYQRNIIYDSTEDLGKLIPPLKNKIKHYESLENIAD